MKTPDNKSEKRLKILNAARKLFTHTHNIKRVSLAAIAGEAGVSPTTIYNQFGDRETLLFEVIKELTAETLERNRALVNSDLPFPQKLIGIIGNKVNIAEQMSRELIEKLMSQDKKIVPFADTLYEQEIKPLWQKIMVEGRAQGYIDPDLDDGTIIAYLDILQAGFRTRPEFLMGFKDNMAFIEQLTRLMFYGFLKKEIDLFRKEEK